MRESKLRPPPVFTALVFRGNSSISLRRNRRTPYPIVRGVIQRNLVKIKNRSFVGTLSQGKFHLY
ncbi:unnamed protein product [Brassica rapa subsp. trilocularis]